MTARARGGVSATLAIARRAVVPDEHTEQAWLFQRAAHAEARYPELRWLYAIPNGGHRHKATAGRLKAEGVRAGYPDIGLDVARGQYHGWRGEMKRQDARPSDVSPAQRAWHAWLRSQGYRVDVCHGAEAAWAALVAYLTLPTTEAA